MPRLGPGEEVADCATYGIVAFLCICSLPAATAYFYNKSGSELAAGVSVLILCPFLILLVPILYRYVPFGTIHKYVLHKLDHACTYLVIAGSYTPIVLMLIDGWQGYLILTIEWSTVLGGVLLKATSSKSYSKPSMAIYMIMSWTVIFFLPTLLSKVSPLFLILIISGGVMYMTDAFFYEKPREKCLHSVWHVCINLANILHFIAIVLVT